MFVRIFSMFMAVILILTTVLTGIAWVTMRDRQINARLDELKDEAYEIAYLASAPDSFRGIHSFLSQDESWLSYVKWKAEKVYKDYGAYIMVVDRYGRAMDNMRAAYEEDPDFVESLSEKKIAEALSKVLNGESIAVKTSRNGDPRFTVGVPFTVNGKVLGAVFIQTKAQIIESGTEELLLQVILTATLALVVAGVCVFLYVRSILKPLRQLKETAMKLSEGNFAVQVASSHSSPEVEELSRAFNIMADQLSRIETNRREFVANVSHELRSPITSISGFVEGMLDGTIPQNDYPQYLQIVSKETKRLSKLIGDLLALSRLERDDAALELTEFDICELLRQVIIRRINEMEERSIELRCDFQHEKMIVCADRDRIEQVIVNLVDNALKFTPDSGCITLACAEADGKCCTTIKDNGIGILPEDRQHVFDRFFTADRAHTAGNGTGLGLSICQRILQMHGQSITLDDSEEGASFTFSLESR